MTLIKKIFKTLAVTALFSSANVLAADFLVDTTISDLQGDANGGWAYEIKKMYVQWADNDLITVDIYTNFVGYNNRTSAGNSRIVLGDLLIGTKGKSNPFDYAFVLSDRDSNLYSNSKYRTKHWDKKGNLTEIDSTLSSKDYHGSPSNTGTGEVMAGTTKGNSTEGDWSVNNYGWKTGKTDKISFSFNVNGIDAFQNASQLAFSWAMSCANDVVDGVVNVDRPTSVPEPTTLLLMLLALGFMAKSRNKKANDFSA
ncbi:PEP-CTERM sorting domain-containing protein [Colwellia demingiae]|uniref:PEP-CTERM sorting domain-containing protein n=1 Tax=Colwellia demingiae TaxID=89401 RepID=A0A5C6QC45_9GAMM|nr:PEP-CTERM sorting domain-containing protein [Colwellia demingiae]TWX66331.1 PEP-CTERM sorting domain-containing protein [Colwellia demingiae]